MVDAVDLLLRKMPADFLVQQSGAFQIATERLFNNNPTPGIRSLRRQPRRAELPDHLGKKCRRNCQIEKDIARQLPRRLHVLKLALQVLECHRIVEIPLQIIAPVAEVLPLHRIDFARRKLLDIRSDLFPIRMVVPLAHRNADHRKVFRQ